MNGLGIITSNDNIRGHRQNQFHSDQA